MRFTAVSMLALAACGRRHAPQGEGSAPSASVVTIGVALGACDDVDVCEKECAAGSADRCRRLAVTYALGRGAEQDEARATALYGRACDMNDAPACVFAGQMQEYARGVPKDDAKAAALYGRACDLGWPPGCYNLAIMVERGRGVPQDRVKSADLYQMACTAGAKQACDKARQLHESPAAPFFDGRSVP
jgi:TPR repeat protein